jgi:CRP-like cAMP-binding protein
MMLVSRGEVSISKQISGEKEVWIRNLGEGDFLGEFGFFTDQKRHATVKTLAECEILEITRNELKEMMKTHPRVKEVLQGLFRQRVLDLFLALSPMFSLLTPMEREEILKRFRSRRVPEGTLLFKGGDPPDSLYLIRSGEVEIFTRNRQGRRVVLGTLKSGNFFGEIGPVFKQPLPKRSSPRSCLS